jgi:molecular chaperone DnaK
MSAPLAIGIDLGTTYSAMARVDEHETSRIVPNAEGELKTPTVAYFEDDRVLVGAEAKKIGMYHANRMAELAKRDMGKAFYSKPIGGRYLPPEVIQAYVLRKLRNDLAPIVGTNVKAVITVPAFFDEPRRKATVDAAAIAGIDVLDIVNEPTAAALAFGEHLGYLSLSGESQVERESMNILVYDLGGGTFDVTIIELRAGDLRTLATDGDMQLGGRDWDACLVDRVSENFREEHGLDPREDPLSCTRLFGACEESKHTLSVRNSVQIRLSHGGIETEYRVTREEFEEETAHLLERTAYVTRQLLTTAGLQWRDLSRILLVGGSTRMPMVARMLEDRTGIVPDHSVNPDEAVARGAALYARFLLDSAEGSQQKPAFSVTNVNSHSLGIEGIDPTTGRRCNNIIIPRNTPLPARKTERFAIRQAGQTSVVIKVLEGESPVPTECTPIGRAVIRDLPANLPGGTRIQVRYEYGTNGRLGVWAKVTGTDREVRLELERDNSLSKDLVAEWGSLVASGAGLSAFGKLADSSEIITQPMPGPDPRGSGVGRPLPQPRPASTSMPHPQAASPQPATGAATMQAPHPTALNPQVQPLAQATSAESDPAPSTMNRLLWLIPAGAALVMFIIWWMVS